MESLREKCVNCGECAEVCPRNARRIFGRYYTVDEILDVAKKDAAFYRRSGGGITVGGGEPLAQPLFVRELLEKARDECGFHTSIETSGYAGSRIVEHTLEHVDFVFCDLKHLDAHKHRELTGVSNKLILDNIRLIAGKTAKEGKDLVIRILIVPGLNDQRNDLLGIASFVNSLRDDVRVELLPYHEFGVPKYRALGRRYPLEGMGVQSPSKEYMDRLRQLLARETVNVAEA